LAAVLVTHFAGTIVSTLFAVEARRRAEGEAEQRKVADRQTEVAKEQLLRAEWLLYANEIAAAQREGELNNPARALEHLDRTAPEQRSWEYYFLRRRSDRFLQSAIRGHSQQVLALALSPDDRILASASRDKTVKLWDRAAERQVRTLNCDGRIVTRLAFGSEGRRLAGISTDGKLRIWEVASGNVEQVVTTHTVSALAACNLVFAGEGESVVTANRDGTLRVWDVATGSEQRSIQLPNAAPSIALSVSRDGRTLACGLPVSTAKSEIRLFDLASGEGRVVASDIDGIVTDVALDDQASRVASGTLSQANTAQGSVQAWDVATGRELARASFRARQVGLDAAGQRLIGIGVDGTMKTWDARSAAEISSFTGRAASQDAITFSGRDGLLVVGNAQGGIELWATG
jgi:WD40 repeat protein